MVFINEGFFEVAIESRPEWDLNPRPIFEPIYNRHWQSTYSGQMNIDVVKSKKETERYSYENEIKSKKPIVLKIIKPTRMGTFWLYGK